VRTAGGTVHFADGARDAGPVLLQAAVRVHDEDTHETLTQRILTLEHQSYPRAIGLLLDGGIRRQGRRILLSEAAERAAGEIHTEAERKPTYAQ